MGDIIFLIQGGLHFLLSCIRKKLDKKKVFTFIKIVLFGLSKIVIVAFCAFIIGVTLIYMFSFRNQFNTESQTIHKEKPKMIMEAFDWLKNNVKSWEKKDSEENGSSSAADKVKLEQHRRLKRLNDIADGLLIPAEDARNETLKIFRTVWNKFVLLRETLPAIVAKKGIREVDEIIGREFQRATEEIKKEIEKLGGTK